MNQDHRIYLASRSPRRRELLTQIGVHFDLLMFREPPRHDHEVNEDEHPGEAPEVYVQRVARAKAEHALRLLASRHLPPRPVLSADTTLDCAGVVVGKPRNEADAIDILGRLSGTTHRVLTSVVVADATRTEQALSISEVRFRRLDADEIARYVRSGEPMDKAGAYGIQGRAAMFIEAISGSHSGIVGLPLCETALLLKHFGFRL